MRILKRHRLTLTACLLITMTVLTGCGSSGGGSSGDGDTGGDSSSNGDDSGDSDGDSGNGGAGNDGDGDAAAEDEAPGSPPLYRVRLQRDTSENISIGSLRYLAPQTDVYPPLPPLAGEFLAITYAGDDVLDVAPVSFPDRALLETLDENLQFTASEEIMASSSVAHVYLDASVAADRLVVVDRNDQVVIQTSDLPGELSESGRSTRPFSSMPWIELYDASDGDIFAGFADDVAQLLTPTADELLILQQTLEAMPLRLASAIHSIGIGQLSRPGLTMGGSVLLQADLLSAEPGRLYHLLAHEAGHAFHNAFAALDGATFPDWADNWPASYRSELAQLREQVGVDRDILTFWQTLNDAAVNEYLAIPYTGDDTASVPLPYESGYVTAYAASKIFDDIADTVAIANMNTTASLSPVFSSMTCTYYQGTRELRYNTALAYLKLRLVQAFGLARDDDVDWCLGNVAPTQIDGIHLGDALLFDRELNAGYTGNDRLGFNVVGQDAAARGLAIELQTEGRRPEGVYPLDRTWWGAWNGDNTLVIASPDDLEARTATQGVVVIAYADSSDRVDGFVFDLHLSNAFGPVSRFDFVPFRIPLD